MTRDARFEDAGEAPLRLSAQSPEDLPVLSSLVQDAVFPISQMRWDAAARRFALLLNRFRWEDGDLAEAAGRPYERVQSVLAVDDARGVASQGLDRRDGTVVLSLLEIGFEPAGDGSGAVIFTLAGDGAIRVQVDCLNMVLRDVTRPYAAPSGKRPDHDR